MNPTIDAKMKAKGYERVSGMAILNDIAVTETHREILSAKLTTPKAVEVFNKECEDLWVLYRKNKLTTQITFSEFNLVRNARGKDAARFDIVDDEGESYWLWMSKADIKRNIKIFPECKAELQKGLNRYA